MWRMRSVEEDWPDCWFYRKVMGAASPRGSSMVKHHQHSLGVAPEKLVGHSQRYFAF